MTAPFVSRFLSAVTLVAVGIAFGAAYSSTPAQAQAGAPSTSPGARVYELRTYTAPDGKLPLLQRRFRDHTIRIFEKHGMKSVGYWVPQDAPARDNTLIYVISHASRDAAKQSWANFAADPEWKKVAAESQVDGPIVSKVVSIYMDATDYSPIK